MPKRTLSDTCCRSDHDCRNPNHHATADCRTLPNAETYRHGSSATLSYSNPYVCPYTDSHSGADARRYA